MKLQGPEKFTSLPALNLLQGSKPSMIMAALVLHRPSIFSLPEWKCVLWRYPEHRSDTEDILDILADCTELYVTKDQFDLDGLFDNKNVVHEGLLRKTNELIDQLEQWELNWHILHPESYCEALPSMVPPNVSDSDDAFSPAWSTILEFESLLHANTYALSNAAMILLLSFRQGVFGSRHPDTVDRFDLESRKFAAAINICRSVEYHLGPDRGGAGSLFLLFPLRMAHDAVAQQNPSIGRWLENVLQKIQQGYAGRWASAEYLLKLGRQIKGPS
jgi:hypothetical protein